MTRKLLALFIFFLIFLNRTQAQNPNNASANPSRWSSASFCQRDFIDIGTIPAYDEKGVSFKAPVRAEKITDMHTSGKKNTVAIFVNPEFITIDGNDVDSLVSALNKMALKVKTEPQNAVEMSYKCSNEFEFKIDWVDHKWYVFFAEYTSIHHYSQISIDVSTIPAFIALVKQAKDKFL